MAARGARRPALALVACLAATALATAGHAPAAPVAGESIVGGGSANAKGWGFAVALRQRPYGFICTGSLIAPTKVLTAAHCVKKTKPRKMKAVVDSAWARGKRRGRRLVVTRTRIHPRYNGGTDRRDLAVLTLRSPAAAEPVALPTRAEAKRALSPGSLVRAAGWGARSAYGIRLAARLKAVKERVFANTRCRRVYGKLGFDPSSMACTLGKPILRFRSPVPWKATSCSGDSGGPLISQTPAGPRVVGVVSVGPLPCGYGGPSIYARVTSGLKFIRRAAGLDPAAP